MRYRCKQTSKRGQFTPRDEYLPFLSNLLMADGMIAQPIQAVIRKGKGHYVCDERLERRLGPDLEEKKAGITPL